MTDAAEEWRALFRSQPTSVLRNPAALGSLDGKIQKLGKRQVTRRMVRDHEELSLLMMDALADVLEERVRIIRSEHAP